MQALAEVADQRTGALARCAGDVARAAESCVEPDERSRDGGNSSGRDRDPLPGERFGP
jgi:hypothetical protein